MFGKNKKVVCFSISDFDLADMNDPELITNLESGLANLGALPAKVDTLENVFCVTIMRNDLEVQEILDFFDNYGLKAQIIR